MHITRIAPLVAAYFAASLAHFSHNAQYIAFYPGMPAWLTPGTVWLCWFAVCAVGLLAWVLTRLGLPTLGLLALGVYGALGLDGLLHYRLGLCSQHTLMANLTIWAEATTGLMLLLVSAVLFARRLSLVNIQTRQG
ncbi:hypothetical protein [Roseateles sp. P5_D6]